MPPETVPTKPDKKPDTGSDLDALSIVSFFDNARNTETKLTKQRIQYYKYMKYIRVCILFLVWLAFTVLFMVTKEEDKEWRRTVVSTGAEWKRIELAEQPKHNEMTVVLKGPLSHVLSESTNDIHMHSGKQITTMRRTPFFLRVQVMRDVGQGSEPVSDIWEVSLVDPKTFDTVALSERQHIFELGNTAEGDGAYFLQLNSIEATEAIPLYFRTYPIATRSTTSIVLSGVLILGMHIMFFWDVLSRAIIAIIGSTLAVALLGVYVVRPKLQQLMQFIDLDVILLIIGLTIIVAILTHTGGDTYIAFQAFRLSNGHIWPMLTCMCLIVAFGAAFLDDITILMLVTSIAIRLCEILELHPPTVLTCLMLFSNIGYMLTGEPFYAKLLPYVQSSLVSREQHHFYGEYMLLMLAPVIMACAQTYVTLRLYYGSSKAMRNAEAPIIGRLRHAIRFWRRAAKSIGDYTKEERAVQEKLYSKVQRLRDRLNRLGKMPVPAEDFNEKLKRLSEKYSIPHKTMLKLCCIVLLLVVLMQIAKSFRLHYLSSGWICMLFALLLIILVDWHDFDSLLTVIDWSTLVLIASLAITIRALQPLGLIDAIGTSTINMIVSFNKKVRLHLGAALIICVTSFSAFFLDTEYVCYVLSNRILDVKDNPDLGVQTEPLLLAVLLGTGFSGNATIIASISNMVCAGSAEKHGFKFYFWDFFKIGFLVMLGNIAVAMIYLQLYILIRDQ